MIELKNITKVYGKGDSLFTALYKINVAVPTGTTVAIIGKSGSGKSTMMHIMSGLDRPSEGDVVINNKTLSELKPKQVDKFRSTEMSFIFQAFFVEANQTCYQNVMLPLEIAKVARRDRRKHVLEALKAVGLAEKIDAQASQLSGGQKQRLAIARAIVNKPQIIFADEPTGNLDSTTGELIIKLLFDIHKSIGATLVIVTHDEELAWRCSMRVYMKDGEITRIEGKTKAPAVAAKSKRRV